MEAQEEKKTYRSILTSVALIPCSGLFFCILFFSKHRAPYPRYTPLIQVFETTCFFNLLLTTEVAIDPDVEVLELGDARGRYARRVSTSENEAFPHMLRGCGRGDGPSAYVTEVRDAGNLVEWWERWMRLRRRWCGWCGREHLRSRKTECCKTFSRCAMLRKITTTCSAWLIQPGIEL